MDNLTIVRIKFTLTEASSLVGHDRTANGYMNKVFFKLVRVNCYHNDYQVLIYYDQESPSDKRYDPFS